MRPRLRKPSQRDIRNHLQGLSALANGTTPNYERKPERLQARDQSQAVARRSEKDVMDDVRQWARIKSMKLFRNNVGSFEYAPGRWMRFGLCTGSSDFIGYLPVTITESMVGKTLAVMVAIEAKRPKGGIVSLEQEAFLNDVRDAGGVCGIATSVDDCEAMLERWRNR